MGTTLQRFSRRKALSSFARFHFASVLVSLLLVCLPGEPAPQTITLAFVGDVMLGRGVAQSLAGDWGAALAGAQPWLAGADLAFANLESPLTTAPQTNQGYDLRASPKAAAALGSAGFDVVSLANNHALDAGEAGLADTLESLEAAKVTGVTDSHLVIRNSAAIHLFAFDDSQTPLEIEPAAQRIRQAAAQVEMVIVSVHWGGEYQAAPSPRQQAIAAALADAGADLIIGHGPHVLQRIEWVGQTLVAYSLGNFLFDQLYPADCRWGVVLRVTAQGGRIVTVEPLPTIIEHGRVRLANSTETAAILARLG